MFEPWTLETLEARLRDCIPYRPVAIIDDPDDPQSDSTAGGRLVRDAQGTPMVREDGTQVVVPAIPYEYWLDADGNLMRLVVGTNRDPQEFDENYAQFWRRHVRAHKWRPLGEFETKAELLAERNKRAEASYERGKKFNEILRRPEELFADKTGKAIERAVEAVAKRLTPEERPAVTYEPVGGEGEARGTVITQVAEEERAEAAKRSSRKREG